MFSPLNSVSRSRALAGFACLFALSAALGGALPTAAPAETARPAPPAPADSAAERLYVLPDTLGVTGERTGAPRSADTATETRLDRTRISSFLPPTVADALVSVPGVDVVKTGAWSARPAIRGLSGDRVLVLVDGIRMNQLRGHGAEPSIVPLGEIESVEVASGSRSSAYGSSAIGGVVNLVTLRPLFAPRPRLDFTLGSRLSEPGEAWSQDVRARVSGSRLALEVSGGLGALDAIESPSGTVRNSGHDEDHYAVRGAAIAGPVMLDVKHSRSDAENVGLPAFNTSAGGAGLYPLKRNDSSRLELKSHDFASFRDVTLLVDRQKFLNHFTETTIDSAYIRGNFAGTVTTDTADRVTQVSRGGQLTLERGEVWRTRLHGELRDEKVSGPRETDLLTRDPRGGVLADASELGESVPFGRRRLLAASGSVSREVATVLLEAGTRWDAFETSADSSASLATSRVDVSESRWSFDGGAAVPVRAVEAYAHAGTGYRVPNLDERFYNGFIHGALYLFGNPDLRPERSVSYEVGVRKSSRWHGATLADFRLSAYRSDVKDLVTFEYVTQVYLIPRFQYRNVANARLEGIEGSLRLARGRVDFAADAGFPRGVNRDTGARLNDVGAARVKLESSCALGWRDLRAGARLRWNDEQKEVDDRLASPSFTTTDLQLSGSWGGTRATFAVRNLFDEDYREPLSLIPESGRTFLLSLEVGFGFDLVQSPWKGTP